MCGRARSVSSGSPRRIWGFRRCLWRSQLAAPLGLLPLDHAGRRDGKHVSTGRRRWEGIGTRLVPAEPGYPGNGNRRYPVKEILVKRKLNLALWIVAGILAVVFLVASGTKLFVPKEKLAGMGGAASRWVEVQTQCPQGHQSPRVPSFGRPDRARRGRRRTGSGALAATGADVLFAGGVVMRLRRGRRQRSSATWSVSPWPPSWRGPLRARSFSR